LAIRLFLGCFVAFVWVVSVAAQEPTPASTTPRYSDSPEGLRSMLQDFLAAMRQKDESKADALRKIMILPSHSSWFNSRFDEADARGLSTRYSQELETWSEHLNQLFVPLADAAKVAFGIQCVRRPKPGPLHHLVAAMKQPATFCYANVEKPADSPLATLGYFIYEGGNFRLVDVAVLNVVKSIKVNRISATSGVVLLPIHRPDPVAPPHQNSDPGKKQNYSGEVVLHIVVGVDGMVKDIQYVSGPRELFPRGKDAVSQWRFRPVSIDGWPVECEAMIAVSFRPLP